ncbi:MAG TPA: cytochrome c oxidase subunit 3 [Terriglobales bacterium]|nr:cytochrome c oxidase subunit 3 [Terriglobales bacterium]
MAPTIPVKEPELGYGGGGAHPPITDGGDGGGGRDNGSPDYGGRLRRTRLGLLIGLASITMVFVALTSAYVVRRGLPSLDEKTSTYVRDWMPVNLPTGLLLVNTFLLLLSSVTAELARRQIARQAALAPVQSIPGVSIGVEGRFPWLGVTVVLGLGFLSGQWMAWQALADRGFYVASNPGSSFVYLLTAAHAVHLTGGILALMYAGITALLKKPIEARRIVVDIAVWYWHFMALLWIYIFALLEFMR